MADFVLARKEYVKRLRHHFIDNEVLEEALRINPYSFPYQPKSPEHAVWIVLPFHPDLLKIGWNRIIEEVSAQYEAIFKNFNHKIPTIKVCWRNSLPSIGREFRRIFQV